MIRVLLKTLVATAIVSATMAAAASPASADPIPVGCAGFPSIPAAFVCVVYVDPVAAPPTVGATEPAIVTIPSFCYVVACTDPTPVAAPSIGESGNYAVIYYNGQTYVVKVGGAAPNPDVDAPLVANALDGLGQETCRTGGGTVVIGPWVPAGNTYGFACEGGDPATNALANALFAIAQRLY